eukprot:TRINITY_DN10225_c0_g1_i1.p1 TRINITY_DN10225_c0_g1~~TRINITY_DN10225_c0_g1_i1.p1  ORF type:complete len:331 (-),score=29.76 TRINITY_DN10225_c0_g1_i1:165-1157(-)
MGSTNSTPTDISNVTVGNILSTNKRPIITVRGTDKIGDALKVLHDNQILSAPVVNNHGHCRKGFFAMDDVIMHLARVCKQTITNGEAKSHHIKTDQIEELVIRRRYFHNETVADVLGRHRCHSKILKIKKNKPISDALHVFAAGVQRLTVLKKKNVIGVLTQSAILKWLAEDTSRLGELENEKAENLGIPWTRLIKINKDEPAIDAVELMHEKCVFSLPLVDDDGNLVGHLSMSDFKSLILKDEDFTDLLLPVYVFVKRYREMIGKDPDTLFTLPAATATIKDVVIKLANEGIHQLYLLNDQGEPTDLISMTNVCYKIFHHTRAQTVQNA